MQPVAITIKVLVGKIAEIAQLMRTEVPGQLFDLDKKALEYYRNRLESAMLALMYFKKCASQLFMSSPFTSTDLFEMQSMDDHIKAVVLLQERVKTFIS